MQRQSASRHGSGENGAALVAVMLLTTLMFALGVFGARTAQIELVIAGNDLQSRRALEIATAGIDHALALLKQPDAFGRNAAANGFNDELGAGGTGGALASLGSSETLGGEDFRHRSFGGNVDEDGYYVRAYDDVDENAGFDDPTQDRNFRIHLLSRGKVGKAERVVHTIIERDALFPCALCGNYDFPILPTDVTLVGQLRVDSFDSRVAAYSVATSGTQGHIISNGSVSMVAGILGLLPIDVRGNVRASSNVVQVGSVTVSGTVTQNAPPTEFPSVQPCGPPYPPNTGITGGMYDQSLGTLINVGLNDVIDLAPGDYCFSSILMAGVSRLRANGPVRIFLTAPSVIAGIINSTNTAPNFRIYSSVSSPIVLPIVPGLVIAGGVTAAAAIYAPDSIVTLVGLTDFYGSIVSAVLPTVGIGGVHYDTALENPGLQVVSWSEERDYLPD